MCIRHDTCPILIIFIDVIILIIYDEELKLYGSSLCHFLPQSPPVLPLRSRYSPQHLNLWKVESHVHIIRMKVQLQIVIKTVQFIRKPSGEQPRTEKQYLMPSNVILPFRRQLSGEQPRTWKQYLMPSNVILPFRRQLSGEQPRT